MILLTLADVLAAGPDAEITYGEHIAPIVHGKCSSCHREGQAGPFPLLTYADVRKRARMIAEVIEDRYMPPWKPVPGHGAFKDERRLTDGEIALFRKWVDQGRAKGLREPPAPEFPEGGWALGKPDVVLKMEDAFEVPAEGKDIYRWFVLKADLPESTWIRAMEFRPSARSVVHHSLYFIDESRSARKLDGKDGKPGFRGMNAQIGTQIGAYVPGATPAFFAEDFAVPLPGNSDIVLQTHFHPTGKAEREQSELALYLTDKVPSRRLVPIQVPPLFGIRAGINVPAGKKDFTVRDRFTIPVDVNAWSIGGHAHYICSEMKMVATLPDGTKRSLLYIDDWDLDWQDTYLYREPVRLPAGTQVETTLVYDNSADNPDNPFDPPQRIKWGRESTDEMGSITVLVTAVEEKDEKALGIAAYSKVGQSLSGRSGLGEAIVKGWMRRLDKNKDGKLQKSEIASL